MEICFTLGNGLLPPARGFYVGTEVSERQKAILIGESHGIRAQGERSEALLKLNNLITEQLSSCEL